MTNTLQTFTDGMRSIWGPLTSELASGCRDRLEVLTRASPEEPWLAELQAKAAPNRELYRDPDHGFMLLAHGETAGLFRPPHDHGRAWVAYALQSGEIEMRTYGRVERPDGATQLVHRDTMVLQAGQAMVYLPGDIHDTRCLSDTALLFRFTERDLRIEDRVDRRLTRYVDQAGVWVPATA